jgi:hypothetical protein
MSSNTANTLGIIKQVMSSGNTIPIPKTNFRLTESQKMGLEKMIWYFDTKDKAFRKFEIQLGFLADGHTPHIVTLEGLAIVKHLNGVLEFEVYGEDGRDILNGMRECYMREGFQKDVRDY